MLKWTHINLAHLVAVHPDVVRTLFPKKHPRLFMTISHRVQPLAASLVRLPDDIVANLSPAEPEHLLLQGQSGEGKL